jgi:hypothetical protein
VLDAFQGRGGGLKEGKAKEKKKKSKTYGEFDYTIARIQDVRKKVFPTIHKRMSLFRRYLGFSEENKIRVE